MKAVQTAPTKRCGGAPRWRRPAGPWRARSRGSRRCRQCRGPQRSPPSGPAIRQAATSRMRLALNRQGSNYTQVRCSRCSTTPLQLPQQAGGKLAHLDRPGAGRQRPCTHAFHGVQRCAVAAHAAADDEQVVVVLARAGGGRSAAVLGCRRRHTRRRPAASVVQLWRGSIPADRSGPHKREGAGGGAPQRARLLTLSAYLRGAAQAALREAWRAAAIRWPAMRGRQPRRAA